MTEPAPWLAAKQALADDLFGEQDSWPARAFNRASRHTFIPPRALHAWPDRSTMDQIDLAADPDGWYRAVYSDHVIVTQQDKTGRSTSSCSQPSMVFAMLTQLDPQPGERVLEIGTGTGWNAGLLAAYLGADQVVSVEVDVDLAEQASGRLRAAGLPVRVITGDGLSRVPDEAPFDRLISTATVHTVPYAWVQQTMRAGVIVTPWRSDLDSGAILSLMVAGDGASASGNFTDIGSSFMSIRTQQFTAPDAPTNFTELATTSVPAIGPEDLFGEHAKFAIGLLVPGCLSWFDYNDEGLIDTVWLCAADSWAALHLATTVHQYGPRRLWDEVESAYHWWVEQDRPAYSRFGVTVTRRQQQVWLDTPDQIVTKTDA
ncbi:protein-L-isoaspartate O-methyltransferase [Allocatelliglobosispora scoriae]|uniref:Protein-L-isoaspartate O-methyltransferase n=1 Tax=Allocatelliglobosispora scoriae TaxID=643052 RepID=A0A841BIQ9_9ACTN|nr:methyltransferase domain-containing protein [Allocatelliglobosispora scoriae]MBB5866662.1 protein-L-isoaspartate O-methyltransferase [Allocatelliglobosispora scoriae]